MDPLVVAFWSSCSFHFVSDSSFLSSSLSFSRGTFSGALYPSVSVGFRSSSGVDMVDLRDDCGDERPFQPDVLIGPLLRESPQVRLPFIAHTL